MKWRAQASIVEIEEKMTVGTAWQDDTTMLTHSMRLRFPSIVCSSVP